MNTVGEFMSHSLKHDVHTTSSSPSSRRRSRRSSPDTVDYRLQVAGSDLHLILEPSLHLLGPGLVVERRQAGGRDSTRISTDVRSRLCHFQGHVRGHPRSTVAVSTCDGLVGLCFSYGTFCQERSWVFDGCGSKFSEGVQRGPNCAAFVSGSR